MNENTKIKLSIVVAIYNHERYLAKAIHSILEQKVNFSYEVLIGEDKSTDGSRMVLEQISENLPSNFHIFYREENFGMIRNFLDLYGRATGEYLIVLEGDDYWIDPNKLQMQVDLLDNHEEYSAVAHNCLVVDENDQINDKYRYPECKRNKYCVQDYNNGILPGQSATLMYRNIFGEQKIPRITKLKGYPGDQLTVFECMCQGEIFCIQKPMSAYRYVTSGGSSFSANFHPDQSYCLLRYKEQRYMFEHAVRYAKNKECIQYAEAAYYIWYLKVALKRLDKSVNVSGFLGDFLKSNNKVLTLHYIHHDMINIIRKFKKKFKKK